MHTYFKLGKNIVYVCKYISNFLISNFIQMNYVLTFLEKLSLFDIIK